MIFLLLDIYLLLVWLVFIRFKLLPFGLKSKIAVGVVGLCGIFGLLIAVNFLHPQSMDARVYAEVIPIASKMAGPGRVAEVRVEPNVPVAKGDTLFIIDPRTNEADVARLEAALAAAEQNVPQLKATLDAALAGVEKAKGQVALSEIEEARNKRLVSSSAVSREEYDKSVRNLEFAQDSFLEAQAQAEKARLAFEAKTADGENVDVAQINAELAKAKLDLEETVVQSPADGYVVNLQLRPGMVIRPGEPVMSFVVAEDSTVVVSMPQEYMSLIEEGNEVEICLDMYPGKTLHGTVQNIIRVSGAGQLEATGAIPTATNAQPAARFPIKVKLDQDDAKRYQPPAGAHGSAAIYTDHAKSLRVVRRVVLRWYTWLNYFKLSM